MRWRIPRFGIFFMIVAVVLALGLLMLNEDDARVSENPSIESDVL